MVRDPVLRGITGDGAGCIFFSIPAWYGLIHTTIRGISGFYCKYPGIVHDRTVTTIEGENPAIC